MSETASSGPDDADIRPIVRTAGTGNRTLWMFAGGLLLAGLLLFNALNGRRQAMVAQTALPTGQAGGMISAPPPLSLPPTDETPPSQYPQTLIPPAVPVNAPAPAPAPQVITRVIERPAPAQAPVQAAPVVTEQQPFPPRAPAVIERPAPLAAPPASAGAPSDRVTASRLLNPSLTVPQGAIIAAVLETALDSTRPGAARAIVSRDIRSFDGSKVLIPRGSKLYGEYASDLSAGQKRALVIWHRLTRPDAVIIDMGSPSADPLGRAGIGGKIDSHFFERYGGAILQSALDIGVAAASQSISNYPLIVALPGSTQQAARPQQAQVQPTLKVEQGTSVSVFVARDLDFSTVDR